MYLRREVNFEGGQPNLVDRKLTKMLGYILSRMAMGPMVFMLSLSVCLGERRGRLSLKHNSLELSILHVTSVEWLPPSRLSPSGGGRTARERRRSDSRRGRRRGSRHRRWRLRHPHRRRQGDRRLVRSDRGSRLAPCRLGRLGRLHSRVRAGERRASQLRADGADEAVVLQKEGLHAAARVEADGGGDGRDGEGVVADEGACGGGSGAGERRVWRRRRSRRRRRWRAT